MEKKIFVDAINAVQKEELLSDNFANDIEKYTSSYVVFNPSPTKLFLLKHLKEEMKDEGNFIDWWLYENVEKQIISGGKTYYINNPEDLYDFLKEVYS